MKTLIPAVWLLSAAAATVIGSRKGQLLGGAFLGLLLGPVGLLIVVASSARPRKKAAVPVEPTTISSLATE